LIEKAGMTVIKISLDTLQPVKFKGICGTDMLEKTLTGISNAVDAGDAAFPKSSGRPIISYESPQ